MAIVFLFPVSAVRNGGDPAAILPSLPGSPPNVLSTEAQNGSPNPYGVEFVQHDSAGGGKIHPGDLVASHFNDAGNPQGTGTTIVSIDREGIRVSFLKENPV